MRVYLRDAQWEKSELDNWSILNQILTAYFQSRVLLSIRLSYTAKDLPVTDEQDCQVIKSMWTEVCRLFNKNAE